MTLIGFKVINCSHLREQRVMTHLLHIWKDTSLSAAVTCHVTATAVVSRCLHPISIQNGLVTRCRILIITKYNIHHVFIKPYCGWCIGTRWSARVCFLNALTKSNVRGTIWDHMGPYGTKVVPKMFEYARDLHSLFHAKPLEWALGQVTALHAYCMCSVCVGEGDEGEEGVNIAHPLYWHYVNAFRNKTILQSV